MDMAKEDLHELKETHSTMRELSTSEIDNVSGGGWGLFASGVAIGLILGDQLWGD